MVLNPFAYFAPEWNNLHDHDKSSAASSAFSGPKITGDITEFPRAGDCYSAAHPTLLVIIFRPISLYNV
ncbi:unnamed protein product [Protopolystoma xenopodis]|uniref:Uncharacterized protein n=1 Tax=Protopolystoma xenopodis TaxID=117903 RepID=A0A3S5AMM4_9PLAT|nr:unnamed protein product [Protopolystoma xenopodis]